MKVPLCLCLCSPPPPRYLASCRFRHKGDYSSAEELLTLTFATYMRTLGEEHASTLYCQGNLGSLRKAGLVSRGEGGQFVLGRSGEYERVLVQR